MRDSTIVKIVAIIGLVVIEVVNLLTMGYDGGLLFAIGSIIGGIAGYEIGKSRLICFLRAEKSRGDGKRQYS